MISRQNKVYKRKKEIKEIIQTKDHSDCLIHTHHNHDNNYHNNINKNENTPINFVIQDWAILREDLNNNNKYHNIIS